MLSGDYTVYSSDEKSHSIFAKEEQMSEKMPKRDVTGNCEGECRNRVKEGEKERQQQLEQTNVKTPEDYPKAPGAEKRDNPPGGLGGHV